MSLSSKSNRPELRTAAIDGTLEIGGLNEDAVQLEADEDSRIIAFQGGKNSNAGFVEVSSSSQARIGGTGSNEVDSNVMWVLSGNSGHLELGDYDGSEQYFDWHDNDELHIHTVNNTGSGIEFVLTVYYLEERDC